MMLQRPGLGVTPGGVSVDAPIVSTHWWCPVPGTPVSMLDSFLGCPKDANGNAPVGAQPSDAIMNPIVYDPRVYTSPPVPPANPAVGAGSGTVAAPYDCSAGPLSDPRCPGYDAALAASTAQQKAAEDAANTAAMKQVADNIRAAAQAACTSTIIDNGDGTYTCPPPVTLGGLSLTTWLLIGAGGFAYLVLTRRI